MSTVFDEARDTKAVLVTGSGVVECRVLVGLHRHPFARLTSAHTMRCCESDSALSMVGARLNGRPVGLAVLRHEKDGKSTNLESIFVVESARRLGVGRRLLERVEAICVETGCETLQGSWFHDANSAEQVHRFLLAGGWEEPETTMTVHRGGRRLLEQCSRSTSNWRPRSGFEIEPWSSLTGEELVHIAALRRERDISSGLHPEGESMLPISDQTSVVLRQRGEIAGWMLHHVFGTETLRYSSLWLRPDLIGRGLGIFLAVESSRRHLTIVERVPRLFFCVAKGNDAMARFIARRLKPGIERSSLLRNARKAVPPVSTPR